MKLYRLFATMGAAAVLCGSLCACGGEPPASTVITKAPEDVVIRTQTTTTVATTTTTLPDFMFPTTDHQNGTSADGQTTPTTVVINDSEASASGKAIAQLAVSLVGTPFEFGGSGPDSFDNPGFVVYCYKQNGFSVPSRAAKMATWGEDVPQDMIQAGDIVLYAGNQMVVFYGSNSWAYTRLGRVTDRTAEEMAELLSNGDVTITVTMSEE